MTITGVKQGQIRFVAEWVEKQHKDSDGEWDPDFDEYGTSHHLTKQDAQAAAIAGSKNTAQCEWILVAEQKYVGHQWIDCRRWTGDWSGLHDCTLDAYGECPVGLFE